jgi:hypothetical protein
MIHLMPASRTAIRPWHIVTISFLFYALLTIAQNNGDPLALVTIGTRFSEGNPQGTEGYDGQFAYYIARDPSTAAQYIDVPAYRFQRILLPALGRLLALGQEPLLPWALLIVNLVALGVGTALMERLLTEHGASRWYALSYGLTIGTFGAARLTLAEPLAYALVLGGIVVLARRERWLWGAFLFALAALAKETTFLFAAGYVLYWLYERRWRVAVLFGIVVIAPFVLWQFVLYRWLGAFGIGSGGAMATSFEVIPFAGIIRILTEGGLGVFLVFGAIIIPFVLVPTAWGLWRCWRDLQAGGLVLYDFLLFTNAFIMLFVPFSTYREPLAILRFIVGLQIAVILYAAWKPAPRALRNTTIWIVTLMFIYALQPNG